MIFLVIQTKHTLSCYLINLDDGSLSYYWTPLIEPCSSFFEIIFRNLDKEWKINSACDKKNFYLICDREKGTFLENFFKDENIVDLQQICSLLECETLACFEHAIFDGERLHRPLQDPKKIEFFSLEQNSSAEIDNYFSNKELFGGILPANFKDIDKEQALLSYCASSVKIESSIKAEIEDLVVTGSQFNFLPLLGQKIESLLWGIKQGLFRILVDDAMLLLVNALLRHKSLPAENFSSQLKFLPACYVLVLPDDVLLSLDFDLRKENEIKLKKDEVFAIPYQGNIGTKGKVRMISGDKKIEFEQERTKLGLIIDTRKKDIKEIQGLQDRERLKTQWHKAFQVKGKF